MPRTDTSPLSPLSLAVLMTLVDGELHGYGIMKAVQEESQGRVRAGAGSLYAALDRMVRAGWIEERAGSEAQRLFAITRVGRAVARSEVERLAAVVRHARQQKLITENS
jgi:DNA-binding PadR family transcriptional regulator